jgi:hypothetical protein
LAKEAKMKKNVFLMGILSVALVFGTALFVGCDSGDGGGGSSTPAFDGSALAGTTWVNEAPEDFDGMLKGASVKIKVTLAFTSDTSGTITAEVTEWIGTWEPEMKTKMGGIITADNGPFTSTYDPATKAGTVTHDVTDIFEDEKVTTTLPFIVEVNAKTLTTTEVDEDDEEDIETTVFNLK